MMEVERYPTPRLELTQSFVLCGGELLIPAASFLPGRGNQVWWTRGTEDKQRPSLEVGQGNQGRNSAERGDDYHSRRKPSTALYWLARGS